MKTHKINGVEFIDGYGRCPKCGFLFHKDIYEQHKSYHEGDQDKCYDTSGISGMIKKLFRRIK